MISSVITGYEPLRIAAASAIAERGGNPILIIEQFPANPQSPRNACLSTVRQCCALVLLVTVRGGFRSPSGQTATEEEFEEARIRNIPVLAFIEEGDKDGDALRLEQKVSDYVDGVYRRRFTTVDELRDEVSNALEKLMPVIRKEERDPQSLSSLARASGRSSDSTRICTVFGTARVDELFEPQQLRNDSFGRLLIAKLHDDEVGLFSYNNSSPMTVHADHLELLQNRHKGNFIEDVCRVNVGVDGLFVIECVLGVDSSVQNDWLDSCVVSAESVESCLIRCHRAVGALLGCIDPYSTHPQVLWTGSLQNLGHKTIERNPQPRTSHTLRTYRTNEPIFALDKPRLVSRQALRSPAQEVERAMHFIMDGASGK